MTADSPPPGPAAAKPTARRRFPSLTTQIFIGLALGVLVGWLWPQVGQGLRPVSLLFLNLIKSIIAPLIFATLVIGIAHTGDIKQVGRMGLKALLYFEIVTTIALFVGLAAVNLTRPGKGVPLTGAEAKATKVELARRAAREAAQGHADESEAIIAQIPDAPDPPVK